MYIERIALGLDKGDFQTAAANRHRLASPSA